MLDKKSDYALNASLRPGNGTPGRDRGNLPEINFSAEGVVKNSQYGIVIYME
ncbi:hypothetical protein [[Clostridium] hylemonae]|uniref:Uncharacterized protein n=1 Tax=[Clostridium] hylemonae DSM 15053 TaxID=553973 RepID=C0C3Q6_9FIRM|nr:hypothetical protein [[Clostridium] hylemonae]EEG73248.1 hypothetical protein CLOHYLEM_06718 [[Clostridium] hylemonae DSM 15053]QEK17502.1 hypothetical protein LAJLEIBI_01512 [[Clostridium] hylemonae DSM 15053]